MKYPDSMKVIAANNEGRKPRNRRAKRYASIPPISRRAMMNRLKVHGVRCSETKTVSGKNGCACAVAASGVPNALKGFQSGRLNSSQYWCEINLNQGSIVQAGAPGSGERGTRVTPMGRGTGSYAPMFVMLETSQPESIRCRCPDTTGANASTSRNARTAAATSQSRFCACGWDLTISAFSSVRGGAPNALPLGLLQLQRRMAHEQMPDHG